MARLRFGTDELGKEILELVPAAAASVAADPQSDLSACSPPSPKRQKRRRQGGETINGATSAAPAAAAATAAADGAERGTSSSRAGATTEGAAAAARSDVGVEDNKPYKGGNTVVMMEWEKPYMRALVDRLGITEDSDVLEIGFGCGYSADRIQEFSPRSHTVIEPDPVVLARLRGWASTRPGVRVVEGFWQTALAPLGQYDAIFFDDFPLPGTPASSDLRGPVSRWHAFIDLCVSHHLPVGGRITGYLARPLPLARPGCTVSPLETFPVDVPDNCPYFPYGEAYLPLITCVGGDKGTVARPVAMAGRARGGAGDGRTATLASSLLLGRDVKSEAGVGGFSERKRQKRQVLEALVRSSLGLGVIGK